MSQIIPWLDKVTLQERKLVVIPEGSPDGTAPHFKNEIVTRDFKSFLLDAHNRPIDFQVEQMMLSLMQLMDVCEKQQIIIESIHAMLRDDQKIFKAIDPEPPPVY